MKKLVYILMIAAVLVSCKKNTTDTPQPVQKQEVEFQVNTILPDAGRDYNIPLCNDNLSPDYAMIMLAEDLDDNGYPDTLYADVYYIGTQLYTKALMMVPGTYHVIGFLVMDDLTGDGPTEDDMIYKAAPLPGSEFFEFVVNALDIEFEVFQFQKTKILIDVLCFVPDYYDLFGFFWFEITEITVREMCFFGDLCLKTPSDYIGSPYEDGGLFIDEPAIFQIWGWHQVGDGEMLPMNIDPETGEQMPYTNLPWYGTGAPLCIRYADYDFELDTYVFELRVLVKVGDGFDFVTLFTWTWTDDFEGTYDVGGDGVAEFVVGNCNYTETDFQLAPYMNIPATAEIQLEQGITGAYFDVMFVDIGDGYDIHQNEWYAGWCGDHNNQLTAWNYIAELYTSLQPVSVMPPSHLTDRNLEALNYLINHFDENGIATPEQGPYGAFEYNNIQQSVWYTVHYDFDVNAPTYAASGYPLAVAMGSMACSPSSVGFSPLPGGFAAIIAYDTAERSTYISQLILILIDP